MPNEYNSELSPSKDIVERLRKSGHWEWEIENICGEAADKIEKLRKEIELLHNIVANVRKDVRDGLYKYEMEKDPTGVKNIKWEKE